MTEFTENWPDDADGDVFRRLAAAEFDFAKAWSVDYNVDFNSWPPSDPALDLLRSMYGELVIYPPEQGDLGMVQFQVVGVVTYPGVTSIQRHVSAAMQPFGGVCESWGVMH